jgi:ABC-2 type transport system ATP-binding protein
MPSNALLDARHLYRYYGPRCAVNDLSLSLQKGEVVGLLGPNGAGKSTTLQMLSGNLAPSTGQITINGFDLLKNPKRAKYFLGYLPEQPPLYLEMRVDEYLEYSARLRRLPTQKISSAMHETKQLCGLEQCGRRLIGNLSKGYRQRIGIAQAIIHSPDVVILDEPTTGLDPLQIHEIRGLIRTLAKQHSVILSTHILPEVQAVCDRVQIIHEGKTVYNESLTDQKTHLHPKTLRVAFQSPPSIKDLYLIPGVEGVEILDNKRLRIVCRTAAATEALIRASVDKGWKLQELTPEHPSLEQIFMEIVYRGKGQAA